MPDYTRVLDGGAKFVIIDQDNPDPLMQYFNMLIANVAGTIQHRFYQDATNIGELGPYSSKIFGASPTPTNTPQVAAGVGFANGAGIEAAVTENLILDTLDQVSKESAGLAFVVRNDTGAAAPQVHPNLRSSNVNGVTRNRICLTFVVDGTAAAYPLTAASIPAGKSLVVRCGLQIR